MAKYNPYNCNQSMLLPITLSQHLYEGSLQEAINVIVEEKLDLSAFDAHYKNDDTGRPTIHPKVLVKVILLAYSHGIVGSRRIEQACRNNVIFLALAGGIQPDHSTIAAFIIFLEVQGEKMILFKFLYFPLNVCVNKECLKLII